MSEERYEVRRRRSRESQSPPSPRRSPSTNAWSHSSNRDGGSHQHRSSSTGADPDYATREGRVDRGGGRYPASTWRPQYSSDRNQTASPYNGRRKSFASDERSRHSVRATEPRRPNVWLSDDYKQKQRSAQISNQSPTERHKSKDSPEESDLSNDGVRKVDTQLKTGSSTLPKLANSAGSTPMDLDSNHSTLQPQVNAPTTPAPTNPNTSEGQQTFQAQPQAPHEPKTIDAKIGSLDGSTLQPENNDSADRTSKAQFYMKGTIPQNPPVASMRPSATNSSPTMPLASPPFPRYVDGARFQQSLQTLVSITLKIIDKEKQLGNIKTLREDRLKDLQRILGSEDAAKQAARDLPDVMQGIEEGEKLRAQIAEESEKSNSIVQELSALIVGPSSTHGEDVQKLKDDLTIMHQSNASLREQNEKLEARLKRLETVIEKYDDPTTSLTETTNTLDSLQAQITQLTTSTEILENRVEDHDKIKEELAQSLPRIDDRLNGHENKLGLVTKQQEMLIHERGDIISQVQNQYESIKTLRSKTLEEASKFTQSKVEEMKMESTKALDTLSVQIGKIGGELEKYQSFEHDFKTTQKQNSDTLGSLQAQLQSIRTNLSTSQSRISNNANPPTMPPQPPTSPHVVNSPEMSAPSRPSSRPVPPQANPSPAWSPGLSHAQVYPSPPGQFQGGVTAPNSQAVLQSTQGAANQPSWRAGVVGPSSGQRDPSARELLTRILGLEHYVGVHEQRLNFTTLEAIWPSLTRYVMDHIARSYRYPETVSRDLTDLQAKVENHTKAITHISNSPGLQQPAPTEKRLAEITTKLNALESDFITFKRSTESESRGTIDPTTAKELERLHARQIELAENLHAALNDHREEMVTALTNKVSKGENSESETSSKPSFSEVLARFAVLQDDFQALEANCVQEMSAINGKFARIAGLVKSSQASSVLPPVARRGEKDHASDHRAGQNGGRGQSSSDESIIASRRKRKRVLSSED